MTESRVKLPGSSLVEVRKVIAAYAERSSASTNQDIAKILETDSTVISRNNGYLSRAGLIAGGQKKQATELGKQLGRSITHKQEQEEVELWRQSVVEDDFLQEVLSAVRVGEVQKDAMVDKILFMAEAKKTKNNRTGAQAIIDLLLRSGLLQEEDGCYVTSTSQIDGLGVRAEKEKVVDTAGEAGTGSFTQDRLTLLSPGSYERSASLQLQVNLPVLDDVSKYAEIFRAIRVELLEGGGDGEGSE